MKAVLFVLFVTGSLLAGAGLPESRGQEKKVADPKKAKAAPGKLDKSEVHVFSLQHTQAAEVAKVLQDLFPAKNGLTLRIASAPTLNIVLVRGSPLEVEMVEAVISKMEDIAEQKGAKKAAALSHRAKIVGARASNSGEGTGPQNAFLPPDKATLGKDAIPTSRWNSGTYAPGWIEVDLGTPKRLDKITLVCCQDIPGETVHEIWISDVPIGGDRSKLGLLLPGSSSASPALPGEDRSKAKLVHTFRSNTAYGRKLTYDFGEEAIARYVQIRTTQSPTWVGWESIDLWVR